MIYVPLFHPKVTGLFPAKSAALFNRYLLQFSIVIYNPRVSALNNRKSSAYFGDQPQIRHEMVREMSSLGNLPGTSNRV